MVQLHIDNIKAIALYGRWGKEYHNSPPSGVINKGGYRCRLSQQTLSDEVGLQISPIRVSEGLPPTASLAHTGCVRIQEVSPNSHDLGGGHQGNGNQCPGLLLRSSNLVVPPSPPHSSSSRGGFRATDQGNSDLSGVDRSNVVDMHNGTILKILLSLLGEMIQQHLRKMVFQ